MRDRIFGAIGVVWGGGILVNGYLDHGEAGVGAYAKGQTAALALGGVLLVAGLYYLLRRS